MTEVHPVYVFHREIEDSLGLTGIERLDYVGVFQLADRLHLPPKAEQPPRIGGVPHGENLDGHNASQLGVNRLEDNPHASLGNGFDQAVLTEHATFFEAR